MIFIDISPVLRFKPYFTFLIIFQTQGPHITNNSFLKIEPSPAEPTLHFNYEFIDTCYHSAPTNDLSKKVCHGDLSDLKSRELLICYDGQTVSNGKCVDFVGVMDVTPAPSIYTNLFPTSADEVATVGEIFTGIQTEISILTEILPEIPAVWMNGTESPSTTSEAVVFTSAALKQNKKKKQKSRKEKRQKFRYRKNKMVKA